MPKIFICIYKYSRLAIRLYIFRSKFRNKFFEIWKKNFPLVCRACRDKFIDSYITHCNLINIHALLFVHIFFGFRLKFRKRIWNLRNAFHKFVEFIEMNLLMFNIEDLIYKRSPAIRLNIVIQTESISECTLKDLSNDTVYDTPTKAEKSLATRKTIYLLRYTGREP